MNHSSDSTEPMSSLSRLGGFTPIDETADVQPRGNSRRWAARSAALFALAGLPLGALVVLFIGAPWLFVPICCAVLAFTGARWGAQADHRTRQQEEEHRKREEDLIWEQKLAAARNRTRDHGNS